MELLVCMHDILMFLEIIYYHLFGYAGDILKVSPVKKTEEGLFDVEYMGLVFRDDPADD